MQSPIPRRNNIIGKRFVRYSKDRDGVSAVVTHVLKYDPTTNQEKETCVVELDNGTVDFLSLNAVRRLITTTALEDRLQL